MLTVKAWKGASFQVAIDLGATVVELKRIIAEARPEFVVEQQKLIWYGQILKDPATLASFNIKPEHFIVVMVSKASTLSVPTPACATAGPLYCRVCHKHEGALPEGRKMLRCTKCHDAVYCSVDCQRTDWKVHKTCCTAATSRGSSQDGEAQPGPSKKRRLQYSSELSPEASELLGVSVSYLEGEFMEAVRSIFGGNSQITFYEINAAMLLGEGPRVVILTLPRGSCKCKVGDQLLQGAGDDEVRARVIRVEGCEVHMVETGTNYDPRKGFDLQRRIRVRGTDLGVAEALYPLSRSRAPGKSWPLGLGVPCPRDGRKNASLVDALFFIGMRHHVGRSCAYLSWAWSYTAQTVVSALAQWCEDTCRPKGDTYVWICALNNNQYRVQEQKDTSPVPFNEFQQIFTKRITDIGLVVPLLDSWQCPHYTKRLWCDLELARAVQLQVPCEIILPPSQSTDFNKAIRQEFDKHFFDRIWRSLGSIKVQDAKATTPEDTDNILKIVRGVGPEVLNDVIRKTLRQWVLERVSIGQPLALFVVLSEFGLLQEALQVAQRVLARTPENVPDFAIALGNVAAGHRALDNHEIALEMDEKALDHIRRTLRNDHPEIGRSMGNLAVAYNRLGRYQRSLQLHTELLAFFRGCNPRDDRDIAQTIGNLACCYNQIGNPEEAMRWHTQARELYIQLCGTDQHPEVAVHMFNVAKCQLELASLDDIHCRARAAAARVGAAQRLLTGCLAIQKRFLPEDHPAIARTERGLEQARRW